MTRRRKTQVQKGITFKEDREIVIRIKSLEGVEQKSIDNYNKVFNDFERCFGVRKHMTNLKLEDARRFIDRQLNEKVQFANAHFRPCA